MKQPSTPIIVTILLTLLGMLFGGLYLWLPTEHTTLEATAPTFVGLGDTGYNSRTYYQNYNDVLMNATNRLFTGTRFNTTQLITDGQPGYCNSTAPCLWVPWYDSSTECNETHLKHTYISGTPNMTQNEMVTDEFSETCLALSGGNASMALAYDACYNTMLRLKSYKYGSLAVWVYNRTNTGTGTLLGSESGTNDTAIDASWRLGKSLYIASNNTEFSTGNRTKYRVLADQYALDSARYELKYDCRSTRFMGQICWWPFTGGDAAASGLNSGTTADYYTGYSSDHDFYLMAYASTGNTTYLNITEDIIKAYLVDTNYSGGTAGSNFRAGHFRMKWELVSGIIVSANTTDATYYWDPTHPSWDTVDALRAAGACYVLRAWNITNGTLYGGFQNMSDYCQAWSNSPTWTATSPSTATVCQEYYFNGTCYTSPLNGMLQNGVHTPGLMYYNTTQFIYKLNNLNSHYGWNTAVVDSSSCGNGLTYNTVRWPKALLYAMGLGESNYVYAGTGPSSGGGNPTLTCSGAGFTVTLHGPTNGSNVTTQYAILNVTVTNDNATNTTNSTNGTLPQTLYNDTFTSDPSSLWTMGSWTWTANDGGVINNTANSGSSGYTPNLSLSQMTNGYTISINTSMSNFTNSKIWFGTTSGSLNGDRILLERNGNNVNVKHDGGAFSSFTVAMNTYVVINISVNLTSGYVNVSSGSSKWSDALANSHLTVNGSYIAFSPGQNMTGNDTLKFFGWNISSINVTNTGTAYNTTTSIAGNDTMNVTFRAGNGTRIYNINGTANPSLVTYNWTVNATGDYNWSVTVAGTNNVLSCTNWTFTRTNTAQPGIVWVENVTNQTQNHNTTFYLDFNATNTSSSCVVSTYAVNTSRFTMNSSTGVLTLAANINNTGVYSLNVTAVDSCSNLIVQRFTVNLTNTAPNNTWSEHNVSINHRYTGNIGGYCSDLDNDNITMTIPLPLTSRYFTNRGALADELTGNETTWRTVGTVAYNSTSGAFEFNGTATNYIRTNSSVINVSNGKQTFTLWFRPSTSTQTGSVGRIFDYPATSNTNRIYLTRTTTNLQITIGSIGTTADVNNTPLLAGVWYHVAIVRDATNNRGLTYFNGVLTNNITVNPNSSGSLNAFYFGSLSGGSEWWNGSVDDFRYYNTELTPVEITAVYLRNQSVRPQNLTMWALFDNRTANGSLYYTKNLSTSTDSVVVSCSDTNINSSSSWTALTTNNVILCSAPTSEIRSIGDVVTKQLACSDADGDVLYYRTNQSSFNDTGYIVFTVVNGTTSFFVNSTDNLTSSQNYQFNITGAAGGAVTNITLCGNIPTIKFLPNITLSNLSTGRTTQNVLANGTSTAGCTFLFNGTSEFVNVTIYAKNNYTDAGYVVQMGSVNLTSDFQNISLVQNGTVERVNVTGYWINSSYTRFPFKITIRVSP